MVIKLGYRRASFLYAAGVVTTFVMILLLPILGVSSYWLLLALLPLPVITMATVTTIRNYDNTDKLIPALGANIVTVLATDAMLALAIFITLFS